MLSQLQTLLAPSTRALLTWQPPLHELSNTHLWPRSSRGALGAGGTSISFLSGLSLITLGTRLAISTL